jgi:hypothetical protein
MNIQQCLYILTVGKPQKRTSINPPSQSQTAADLSGNSVALPRPGGVLPRPGGSLPRPGGLPARSNAHEEFEHKKA